MPDFNPYAAPEADVSSSTRLVGDQPGVWRDGKILVMTRDVELPDRCVTCNEPAHGIRLKRRLNWHPPGYFLFLVINVILYAIVAVIVMKRARIQVGLCELHQARRRRAILVGWAVSLLGIVLVVLGVAVVAGMNDTRFVALCVIGVIVFVGGPVYGMIASQTVVPTKIDERFVWLKNVHPYYLGQLPDWPRA